MITPLTEQRHDQLIDWALTSIDLHREAGSSSKVALSETITSLSILLVGIGLRAGLSESTLVQLVRRGCRKLKKEGVGYDPSI